LLAFLWEFPVSSWESRFKLCRLKMSKRIYPHVIVCVDLNLRGPFSLEISCIRLLWLLPTRTRLLSDFDAECSCETIEPLFPFVDAEWAPFTDDSPIWREKDKSSGWMANQDYAYPNTPVSFSTASRHRMYIYFLITCNFYSDRSVCRHAPLVQETSCLPSIRHSCLVGVQPNLWLVMFIIK
jgi:hypothetical protein